MQASWKEVQKDKLTLNYSRWCILYTIFTNFTPPFYFEILQAASAIYPLINSTGMLWRVGVVLESTWRPVC